MVPFYWKSLHWISVSEVFAPNWKTLMHDIKQIEVNKDKALRKKQGKHPTVGKNIEINVL